MVKMLSNLFNKRKREIERLGHIILDLEIKKDMIESNFRVERAKNALLEREKDDLINRIAEITGVLSASAWIISIITIFGSSIALMNIMLVSVTERTREIGVRKALGAK